MPTTLEQYRASLDQPNFWRLFVDGCKQKLTRETKKNLLSKYEADHGYVMWATREPDGLHCMRQSAKWLLSDEKLNQPVTFDLICELHKQAYPMKSHLLFSHDNMLNPGHEGKYFSKYRSDFTWVKKNLPF